MPDEKLTAYRGGKALRRGWTTGSCAAAASQAAAVLLLTGIAPPEIHLHTPGGITFCLPVEDAHRSGNAAVCTVRKDSGDDPDITNGVRITASVRRIEKGVTIEGGAGVGRITRPGTGDAGRRSGDQSRSAAADRGRSAPCRGTERIRRRLFCHHFGGGRRGAAARRPTNGHRRHRRRHLDPRHERHR